MEDKLCCFEDNPIIAAVKDDEQLERAIASDCGIIFFLYGNICTIPSLVARVEDAGKRAFVHLDLTQGLSGKDVAADFIKEYTRAHGVISTRPPLLRRAGELGLATVLRIFLVDSLSLANLSKQINACEPDMVEIMPGVMPKAIRRVCAQITFPVIAGGMIADREDAIAALSAGAMCVSSSCVELWETQ